MAERIEIRVPDIGEFTDVPVIEVLVAAGDTVDADQSLMSKIETVATRIYGAERVQYTMAASRQLQTYEDNGYGSMPVCIAKTHLSISGDPSLTGAPTGHTLHVREVRASVGAGFVYPICGTMSTMPAIRLPPMR